MLTQFILLYTLEDVLFNVGCSILASTSLFFFFFWLFRPKLKISNFLHPEYHSYSSYIDKDYTVSVRGENRSFWGCANLKIRGFIIDNDTTLHDNRYKEIEVYPSSVNYFPGRRLFSKKNKMTFYLRSNDLKNVKRNVTHILMEIDVSSPLSISLRPRRMYYNHFYPDVEKGFYYLSPVNQFKISFGTIFYKKRKPLTTQNSSDKGPVEGYVLGERKEYIIGEDNYIKREKNYSI